MEVRRGRASVSNKKRIRVAGLEAPSSVTFKLLDPTKSYKKNIVITNTKLKLLNVQLRTPTSLNFHVPKLNAIKLSPGNSFTIPVTFHPRETYEDDSLVLSTSLGTLSVTLKATKIQASLLAPKTVHLGYAAVGETARQTFEFENCAPVATTWKLTVPEPFFISPSFGELEPNSKCSLVVTWNPKEALVYEAQCTLKYNTVHSGSKLDIITLEGLGQLPCVFFESETGSYEDSQLLDFGSTFVGHITQKIVKLHNPGKVDAKVVVNHRYPGGDCRFTISKLQEIVPAGGSVTLKVEHLPKVVSERRIEYFDLLLEHGNTITVECKGSATGPVVSLPTDVLNFVDVECGEIVSKSFKIENHSAAEVTYQILAKSEGPFKFSKLFGVLKAFETGTLEVTFSSKSPLHFRRLIKILIHNHQPLELTLLANSRGVWRDIERVETKAIEQYHLLAFQHRLENDLLRYPPSALRSMLASGDCIVDEDGFIKRNLAVKDDSSFLRYSSAGTRREHAGIVKEDITKSTDMDPYPFRLSHEHVGFGACPAGSLKKVSTIPPQTITLTNSSQGEAFCSWTPPNQSFEINPLESVLAPGEIKNFEISFLPVNIDQFYMEELECFVSYTEDRLSKHTEDNLFTPPFRFTSLAFGHTILAPDTNTAPKVVWDTERIVFPPVEVGQQTNASGLLENHGDTTVNFKILSDLSDVECFPVEGLIPPQSRQLFSFKMSPKSIGLNELEINYSLNGSKEKKIVLACDAVQPIVTLDSSMIVIPPTMVGYKQIGHSTITNSSTVPVSYAWIMPKSSEDNISVSPKKGVLDSFEKIDVTWTFVPHENRSYNYRIPLAVGTSADPMASETTQESVLIIAEAAMGVLVAVPDVISNDPCLVTNSVQRSTLIRNTGDVTVEYFLEHDCNHHHVSLDHVKGILAPGTQRDLVVKVQSSINHDPSDYDFAIFCNIVGCSAAETKRIELLRVNGSFVKPSLQITNVNAKSQSKQLLWSMFSVDEFNTILKDDTDIPESDGSVLDLHFVPGVIDSETLDLDIQITNTGPCQTHWDILFPNQINFQPEKWAEDNSISLDKKHEKMLLDKKVFKCTPSRGIVSPGENTTIRFSYKHLIPGINKVPIKIQIEGRHSFTVNICGTTLEKESPRILLPTKLAQLVPVAVGLPLPTEQAVHVYNVGDVPVDFTLDIDNLQKLKEENYDVPVLFCDVQRGCIQPGDTFPIPIKCWPLAAKDYAATVNINVQQTGEIIPIPISVSGFDVREQIKTGDMSLIPKDSLNTVEEQFATLSQDFFDFGDMVMFGMRRQTFFIKNRNKRNHPITFKFVTTPHSDIVVISPEIGHLEANESKPIFVTFLANTGPTVFNFDIKCEIDDLQEISNHRAEQQAAALSREKVETEFTFTDADRTGRGRAGGRKAVYDGLGQSQVYGAEVNISKFPQKAVTAGFRPSYTSNLSPALTGSTADKSNQKRTNRNETLKGYVQKQSVHKDTVTYEEEFVLDQQLLASTNMNTPPSSGALNFRKPKNAATIPVADSELRATKYLPLPPIQVKSERSICTPPPLAHVDVLRIGIRACVVHPKSVAVIENHVQEQFVCSPSLHGCSRSPSPILFSQETGEDDVVIDMLSSIIQDIVTDDSFSSEVFEEAANNVPYYHQIAQSTFNETETPGADLRSDLVFLSLAEQCFHEIFTDVVNSVDEAKVDLTERTRLLIS